MFVINRQNVKEPVSFDQILRRIEHMTNYPSPLEGIDCAELAKEVIGQLICGMETRDIDNFTAQKAASKVLVNFNYEKLAMRISVDNHHKNTLNTFSEKVRLLQSRVDENGEKSPYFSDEFYTFVIENSEAIDAAIDYSRDFMLDYFGFASLYSQYYLLRLGNSVIERPQDMFMRVSVFIYMNSLDDIIKCYEHMSKMYFIQASPTLFNAGLKKPGCISCFLAATDDSKEGIQRVVSECSNASAACGGVAFSASPWRCKGSLIRSSGGRSDGVVPFIQWAQGGVNSFNQGSRRNGSLAVYLDVHHPDLIDFLKLRVHGGDEKQRCRDVFLGLWISDIFMRRVKEDGMWSFFDPGRFPELLEMFGQKYEEHYQSLEVQGKFKFQMRAREVWKAIFETKRDSGIPYMMAKDAINRANNQGNIGLIKTSNLCAEIVEYSDNQDDRASEAETACCTLGSIALPKFVEDEKGVDHEFPLAPIFNYKKLGEIVGIMVKNLNKIIDKSYYPSSAMERGNTRHRPIGIGVQGLADVYAKFRIAFDSPEARELNKRIFETIYFSAVSQSALLARDMYRKLKKETTEPIPKTSGAYSTYLYGKGAPLSQGKFNFQLYGLDETNLLQGFDWDSLREFVKLYGVRNSLLIAAMPTASTSQIFRNTECFEPRQANIFLRKVMGGEYFVVNKYLYHELKEMGAWTEKMVDALKMANGSIQGIESLPLTFRHRYKTAWEIEQKHLVQQAADRQPFIDQSQSMNLFFEDFDIQKFTASHFTGWSSGLKTLSYYIRQRPAVLPMQTSLGTTYNEIERPAAKIASEEELGCSVCGA